MTELSFKFKNISKTGILKSMLLGLGLVYSGFHSGQAQSPEQWNSSEIYHALEKFNTFGSVLYIGAHPDDDITS